ncbi:MAG: hypothetical protein K8I03_02530 [Ignavibacteria bacterium]|nr:hypothetical protein [Ignavibacteria bacterium]
MPEKRPVKRKTAKSVQKRSKQEQYIENLKLTACKMMRVYSVLNMEDRVHAYYVYLEEAMGMNFESILKMFDSVSITTELLLSTIKDEEEEYWEKGIG